MARFSSGTPGGQVDLGPVGSIGPHGSHRSRVIGIPGGKALVGLLTVGVAHHYHKKYGTRDYDDDLAEGDPEGAPIEGTIGGRPVKATPPPRGKDPTEKYRGSGRNWGEPYHPKQRS